jgi:7-cyano-7-deazaguanine synthase
MADATVLFSGGIDSTSAVHFLRTKDFSVRGLFVDFGQASARMERRAIKNLQRLLDIPITEVSASGPANFGAGELTGRNAFLVFSALLLGGCDRGILALGIHDGTPYFDCSMAFLGRIDGLVSECTDGKVSISAPFAEWSKDEIYSYFLSLNIPLDSTYSCEAGAEIACGICASCRDRKRIECLPREELCDWKAR